MSARVKTEAGVVGIAWDEPAEGDTYLLLGHGAGGTMHTPSMKAFAKQLAARGIGAVRFNFAYAEAGKKGPDRQPVLEATYRAIADRASKKAGTLLLGGRSMGGRIASHIVSDGYSAAGLVFLAYPLHPPGKPERLRDEHLTRIDVPMLFLQGTKDPFARPDLLDATIARLPSATLHRIEGGDHSHRVSGRKEADVIDELVSVTERWVTERIGVSRGTSL